MTTLDAFKIASSVETTANKIHRLMAKKKNKSGDGSKVKGKSKKPSTTPENSERRFN